MASFGSIAVLWGRRLFLTIGGWFALWLVSGTLLSIVVATFQYGADIDGVLAGVGRTLGSEEVWARLAGLTAIFSAATIFTLAAGDLEKRRQRRS